MSKVEGIIVGVVALAQAYGFAVGASDAKAQDRVASRAPVVDFAVGFGYPGYLAGQVAQEKFAAATKAGSSSAPTPKV